MAKKKVEGHAAETLAKIDALLKSIDKQSKGIHKSVAKSREKSNAIYNKLPTAEEHQKKLDEESKERLERDAITEPYANQAAKLASKQKKKEERKDKEDNKRREDIIAADVEAHTIIHSDEVKLFPDVPGDSAHEKSVSLITDYCNALDSQGNAMPDYDIFNVLTRLERLDTIRGEDSGTSIKKLDTIHKEEADKAFVVPYDPNDPHNTNFKAGYTGKGDPDKVTLPGSKVERGEDGLLHVVGDYGTANADYAHNKGINDWFKSQIDATNEELAEKQEQVDLASKPWYTAKNALGNTGKKIKEATEERNRLSNIIPGSFSEISADILPSSMDSDKILENFRGDTLKGSTKALLDKYALANAFGNGIPVQLQKVRDSVYSGDPHVTEALDMVKNPELMSLIGGVTEALDKRKQGIPMTLKENQLVNLYDRLYEGHKKRLLSGISSDAYSGRVAAIKDRTATKRKLEALIKQQAAFQGGYGQQVSVTKLPENPNNGLFIVRSRGKTDSESNYGNLIGRKMTLPNGETGIGLFLASKNYMSPEEKAEWQEKKKASGFKGKLEEWPPYLLAAYSIHTKLNRLPLLDIVRDEKGNPVLDANGNKQFHTDKLIHTDNLDDAMEIARQTLTGWNAHSLNPLNASRSDYIREVLMPKHREWMKESYGGKTWDQIVEQAYKESLALGHLNNEKRRQTLDAANAEALRKQEALNVKKAADPNYKPTAEELPDSSVMGEEYYNQLANIAGLPKQKTWYNNAFKNWKALKNSDTGILEFLSDEDAKKYEQKQALDLERRRVADQNKKKEDVIAKYNSFVDTIARQRDILEDDKASPLAKLIATRRLNKADKARRAFLQEYIFESGIDEERDEDDELVGGTLRIKDENGNYTHILPPQAAYNIINKPTGDVYASVRSGMAKYMLHNGMLTDPESIPKPETEDDEALLDYYQDVIDANKDNLNTLSEIYAKLWRKKNKTPADEKQLLSTYRTIAQLYELGDDYQSDVDTLTRQIKSKKTAFDSEKRHAERLKRKTAAQAIAKDYAEGQQDEDMFEDREAKIDEMIKRTQGDPAMQAYWQREKNNYSGRKSNVNLLIDRYGNVIATTAAGKSGKSDAGIMLQDEAAANRPDTNVIGNLVKDAAHDAKKAGGKAKAAARNLKNAGKANNVKTTKNSNGSVTKETTIKPNNDNVNLGPMAEVVQQGMPGSRNDSTKLADDDQLMAQLNDED